LAPFFAIFRSIVNALTASLVPVLNAFAIVLLLTSIYAIEGVNLFASRDSENFGNFLLSLYTMFQVGNPTQNPRKSPQKSPKGGPRKRLMKELENASHPE
jgi:hypothetical protein